VPRQLVAAPREPWTSAALCRLRRRPGRTYLVLSIAGSVDHRGIPWWGWSSACQFVVANFTRFSEVLGTGLLAHLPPPPRTPGGCWMRCARAVRTGKGHLRSRELPGMHGASRERLLVLVAVDLVAHEQPAADEDVHAVPDRSAESGLRRPERAFWPCRWSARGLHAFDRSVPRGPLGRPPSAE
jgi:hypothetical protein